MKKITLNAVVGYGLVLVLAIGASLTGIYIARNLNESPLEPVEQVDPLANFPVFKEYSQLVKKGQSINLVKEFPSYTPNNSLPQAYAKGLVRTGSIKINQPITRGYIYLDLSVDNDQTLTSFDSISLKLAGIGGHLYRKLTQPVPKNHTTHLLYDLREIPYFSTIPYDETKKPKITSWYELINNSVGKEISYESFISSLRPYGKIVDISISYDCDNFDANAPCLTIK